MKETLNEVGQRFLPKFISEEMEFSWLMKAPLEKVTDPKRRRIGSVDFVKNEELRTVFDNLQSSELQRLAQSPNLRVLMDTYGEIIGQKFPTFQDFLTEISIGMLETDLTTGHRLSQRFCALLIDEWNAVNGETDGRRPLDPVYYPQLPGFYRRRGRG